MQDPASKIADFRNKKILLIGDVMLDRYIYGRCDRISPEAPVPVINIDGTNTSLGGAGTVLRNIADLGGNTIFVSIIGDDAAGHEVTKQVSKIKYTDANLFTEMGRPTTVKTRYVAGHYQVARADEETCRMVTQKTIAQMQGRIFDIIDSGVDAVIISDYAKGSVTGKGQCDNWGAWKIIERAKTKNIPVVVDPKSDNFALYAGATIMTPNIPELNKAVKGDLHESEEIILAAVDLIEKYKIENMLVTRSKDGMTLVMGNGDVHSIPSKAKDVYDVTGAGDTAVSVLALGMAIGLPLPDAAYLANAAAGIVVGKLGTATVTPEELLAAI